MNPTKRTRLSRSLLLLACITPVALIAAFFWFQLWLAPRIFQAYREREAMLYHVESMISAYHERHGRLPETWNDLEEVIGQTGDASATLPELRRCVAVDFEALTQAADATETNDRTLVITSRLADKEEHPTSVEVEVNRRLRDWLPKPGSFRDAE